MTLDELTERIRASLDRSGQINGSWEDSDTLARTIAIDIDREESADVNVIHNDAGQLVEVKHGSTLLDGLSIYITDDGALSLPVGYDGELDRDLLPELLAILNHIERNNIR